MASVVPALGEVRGDSPESKSLRPTWAIEKEFYGKTVESVLLM